MNKFISTLVALVEPFRVFKHYRERQAQHDHMLHMERERERRHQLELMETIFTKMEETQRHTLEGFSEIAKGNIEMARAFSNWIELFKATSAPTSSVIRDDDEWLAEQAKLKAEGFPIDMPAEFQLAAVLHRMEQET